MTYILQDSIHFITPFIISFLEDSRTMQTCTKYVTIPVSTMVNQLRDEQIKMLTINKNGRDAFNRKMFFSQQVC